MTMPSSRLLSLPYLEDNVLLMQLLPENDDGCDCGRVIGCALFGLEFVSPAIKQ